MSKPEQKIIISLDPTTVTAHLHPQGKTEKVENQDGYSVVPIRTDWRKLKL